MPATGQLGQVADRLGSLGGVAERHFAAIGHSLEQAVGVLGALTATFQALLGDLRGAELAESERDLAAVATRVGELSDIARADVATLRQLADIVTTIDGRIARALFHPIERQRDGLRHRVVFREEMVRVPG